MGSHADHLVPCRQARRDQDLWKGRTFLSRCKGLPGAADGGAMTWTIGTLSVQHSALVGAAILDLAIQLVRWDPCLSYRSVFTVLMVQDGATRCRPILLL